MAKNNSNTPTKFSELSKWKKGAAAIFLGGATLFTVGGSTRMVNHINYPECRAEVIHLRPADSTVCQLVDELNVHNMNNVKQGVGGMALGGAVAAADSYVNGRRKKAAVIKRSGSFNR